MLFPAYQKLDHDEQLFTANSTISKVKGKGKAILKWTFEKKTH